MPYRVDIAPVGGGSRPEGRNLRAVPFDRAARADASDGETRAGALGRATEVRADPFDRAARADASDGETRAGALGRAAEVRADPLDRLVELGAIDVEPRPDGGLAALMPDSVARDRVVAAFGADHVSFSPATPRDAGSVWILRPRAVHVGRIRIVPADGESAPDAVKLIDGAAFGTGLHPTTALCLRALQDAVQMHPPNAALDVGTGSGVLALAALALGVPRALGIDIDGEALEVAAENARLNRMEQRLRLVHGGPEAVAGAWPLVLANVLAAPLIEMAPALVRRMGHDGRLVLSGIPSSVEEDVDRAYRGLGLRRVGAMSRDGWVALVMQATW